MTWKALRQPLKNSQSTFAGPGSTPSERLKNTHAFFSKMSKSVVSTPSRPVFLPLHHSIPKQRTGLFTQEELQDVLGKIPSFTAPGNDSVPNVVFKLPGVQSFLLTVLNHSLSNKAPPTLDGTVTILQTLIPKKGDLRELANWRPICLLDNILKIYDKLLHERVLEFVDKHLRFNQAGFRPGRGTEELQAALVHAIQTARAANTPLCVLFVDFAKAFPSISWVSIDTALEAHGVDEFNQARQSCASIPQFTVTSEQLTAQRSFLILIVAHFKGTLSHLSYL